VMFTEMRRLLPGREDILFVKANNEPSLRAHRKKGMQKVAEFTQEGTEFMVFACRG
jgi:L-amino acid N-acyltransferase YncA